ncbi:MAG: DUF2892 domain-containing protein [Dehalococcoidia bacterium]|nr:DUF2892 domain-containing protein [Dehalococcoidia bacterium]
MSALVQFMNSPIGRLARVALGVAIIAYALTSLAAPASYVVAAVGLLPIALGASGRCLVEFVAPPSTR